ncbi:MAG TPA: hypothetical protein PLP51_01820 [Acholeplasmataceae bacterium]|jgi:hypothetical protein|nr:hypothetical protein [Acholeplasmataceae bacterium]
MNRLSLESAIVINNESYVMKDLVFKLANLPSSEFSNFLKSIGLTVPKKLKIAVLKRVLKEAVDKTIEERAKLADELGYRLSWFSRYSEYQLENLLKFYDSVSLNKGYLEALWLELFNYMMEKKVSDVELHRLVLLAEEYKSPSDEDILEYNLALKDSFYDEPNEIDGLAPNEFRPVLFKSSTLVELRELGLKYDVNVPKRLKKEQLADIIIAELNERGSVSEEREAEIRKMSIVVIQRFAKDNDIKASIELKKEEVIEYILANASQTKEMYFLPSDSTIYMQELEPQVKEEPVVEEVVVEEVQEEIVVVEEPVEEFEDDYAPVLEEIKFLRKLLADHVEICDAFNEEKPVVEEIPEERPTLKEPIFVNTASFYSDKKHAKKDFKDFTATIPVTEEAEEQAAEEEAVAMGRAPQSKADDAFVAISWVIAIILLGVVVYLLVNYLRGGII